MERYEERKGDFYNAFDRLKEATKEEYNQITVDAILHRFEFTFELAWKTVKDYLDYLGYSYKNGSPREVIQNGYKQGIIKDGELWIEMMLSQNQLSHIYDEKTSRDIYKKIVDEYIKLFEDLKSEFEKI